MRRSIIVAVAGMFLFSSTATAMADGCGWVSCSATGGGLRLEGEQIRGAKQEVGRQQIAGRSGRGAGGSRDGVKWEVTLTPGCADNDPNRVGDGAYDGACVYMNTFCALHGRPQASSLLWEWRRPVNGQGSWVRSASLCRVGSPTVAATPGARPVITAGLVQRAFRELRFAPAVVRIQPEGYVTLVNLETFYRVAWEKDGYEPSEVATVTLLGRRVRFLPRVAQVTYHFGDGHDLGPTADLGGVYPDGGVRHTYRHSGSVQVSVTATYAGQYALSGGPWREVDIEVPVAGTPAQVQVKQARNRLVSGQR